MNKIISFILLCALLLTCFSGCSTPDNSDGETKPDQISTTPANDDKSDSDPVIPEGEHTHSFVWTIDLNPTLTTTGIKHKECESCGYKAEENTEIPRKNTVEYSHTLDEELVKELSEYLRDYRAEYDIPGWTFEEKLDLIKGTHKQSAFVKFSDDCYYVAAYHASSHEEPNEESISYCCYKEYIWVGYKSIEEIKDKVLGRDIVVAFQINTPEICENVLDASDEVYIEHFTLFKPKFESGVAVDPQLDFDDCFIFINYTDKAKVYYSSKLATHEPWSIDCIEKDGEYFVIPYYAATVDGEGQIVIDLSVHFGKYEDVLMNSIVGYYEIQGENSTETFLLFKLRDIEKLLTQDTTNKSNDDSNSTDNINNDNNVNHIIVGTDPSSEPISQYAISVKISEKYELSETGIPISVSYGLIEGADVNRDSYTDIVLKAENEDGHSVILNTFNIEEILKSDYAIKCFWDDNQEWIVGFDYSYTESYALPLSLFFGNSGRIFISLFECNSADLDGLLGAGAYISLYYMRYDTYISISTEINNQS